MKHLKPVFFLLFIALSTGISAQKDLQPTPELRLLVQQGWKIQHAHLSFDSLTIYFSAIKPGQNNYDIYISRSRAGFWSTPTSIGGQINSNDDELWPTISSDQRKLLFIRHNRDSKKAPEKADILYIAENLRGNWELVEPTIITSGHDISPLIMPDNQNIIFARHEAEKKRLYYALYHTSYIGHGIWTIPTRLDSAERRSLYGPYFKNEGDSILYLTELQEVERGKNDIDSLYFNRHIILPQQLRRQSHSVLAGTITDENTGKAVEANIRLYDAITANLLDEALSDATTGRFRVALQAGNKYNIDITAPNYSHYYTTIDCSSAQAPEQHNIAVQIVQNLNIRINPFDSELYTPEPPEREIVKNVETNKNLRVRTKREEQGRAYELPIGAEYSITIFRRGYHDTTILVNTHKHVRFSSSELDIPFRPIKVPLVIQLGDSLDSINNGTIRLRNRNKHEIIEMPYTPPTTQVLIRQQDEYEMVIQSPGHFYFDTIVSIPDGYDTQLCNIHLTPIQKDMVVQLQNILFENNSFTLSHSSYSELDKVVRLLEANPELKIELSAHTDDVGSDAYNDQLSTKRGESVVAYIVKAGIAPDRLTSIGYGKRKPLVPNDSEANRAINRRVEFKVLDF